MARKVDDVVAMDWARLRRQALTFARTAGGGAAPGQETP
jgi:hypothetical protein